MPNDTTSSPHDTLHGYFIEDLSIGMDAMMAKTVTEADIVAFAGVSGDFNPVHVNENFAKTTMFKRRIAHGILSASFISAVLGCKLPGPGCIYLKQSLKFLAPVMIGDTVTARVKVTAIDTEKKRVTLETGCEVEGKAVLAGEAVLMVSSRSS